LTLWTASNGETRTPLDPETNLSSTPFVYYGDDSIGLRC